MKLIQITLAVEPKYKYIAMQPWGEWLAFINKPTIFKDEQEEYWDQQKEELSLSDNAPCQFKEFNKINWKNSVREI